MKANIVFTRAGTASCLYTELIPLHRLGRLACQRASTIEFDEKTQRWAVRRPGRRRVLFSDRSRQACLEWEQRHLA